MNKFFNYIFLLLILSAPFAGNLLADDIIPTPLSSEFYGSVSFNGGPAPVGTVVDAYDPQGVHCGSFTVDSTGIFGFMPVYGDYSDTTGVDEGAETGDVITLTINGRNAVYLSGDSTWTDKVQNQVSIATTGNIDFIILPFENVIVVTPPDTVASFSVGVLNQGDGVDFYGVTSTSNLGWITIDQDSASYAMSPGDTAYVGFDVIVPPFGSEKIDTINFFVYSHLDTNQKLDMAFVIKGINDTLLVINFTVIEFPGDTAANPGDTVSFSAGIRNDNLDAQITDYYCVASSSAHNWQTITSDIVTVAVGDTGYLSFEVVVPEAINTLYDTISYTIYSKLDTTQRFDSTLQIAIILDTNTVMTVVETPASRDTAFVGSTIRFYVGLRNDGPSVDIYGLTSSSAKGWTTTGVDTVFNSSGDTAYVYMDVTLPALSNRLMDTISYTVFSQIDPSQTFSGSFELLSVTDTTYAFSIVDLPTAQSGSEGDTVRFSIGIRNDGNFSDIFGMATFSFNGWSLSVNDSLVLSPTDTGYFDLDVIIPISAIDTSDLIDISIFSYFDTTISFGAVFNLFNLITDIDDDKIAGLPSSFEVNQNYPNPFNPTTTIPFALPGKSEVSLQVINLLGQIVDNINLGTKSGGEFNVQYDGSNLASGVYFYRIVSEYGAQSKKMVLLK